MNNDYLFFSENRHQNQHFFEKKLIHEIFSNPSPNNFHEIFLGVDQGKGSASHKNAVVGDTLGDPLKDTSGPALNILLKLSAVTALTFYTVIKHYSNESGDPKWWTKTNNKQKS